MTPDISVDAALMIVGVLVYRLGGSVTISTSDIDAVPGLSLLYSQAAQGAITISLAPAKLDS